MQVECSRALSITAAQCLVKILFKSKTQPQSNARKSDNQWADKQNEMDMKTNRSISVRKRIAHCVCVCGS